MFPGAQWDPLLWNGRCSEPAGLFLELAILFSTKLHSRKQPTVDRKLSALVSSVQNVSFFFYSYNFIVALSCVFTVHFALVSHCWIFAFYVIPYMAATSYGYINSARRRIALLSPGQYIKCNPPHDMPPTPPHPQMPASRILKDPIIKYIY